MRVLALPIAIVLLTVAGCKSTSPIVGSWEGANPVMGVPATQKATFTSDGKFTTVTVVPAENGRSMTATDRGTWTLEEGKLTKHYDDIDMTFDAPPTMAAKAKERFLKGKPTMLKNANAMPTETVVFVGDDTMESTDGQGRTFKFTRSK